ncbi:MAG: phosphoribosylanthranilate isomerase [Gemmatimonadales bacterium]
MIVDVKICGLTRPADAALAARHGAWRLGVIFAGGPRQVDAAQAREIVAAAAGVPVLGVFAGHEFEEVLDIVAEAGLAGVQLHGASDAGIAARFGATGLEVWRVASVESEGSLAEVLAERATSADALLVEPRHPDGLGGKGIALPQSLAIAARRAAPPGRFVLAGGLQPENVVELIRVVGPDAVDVSSGVESAPGRKDAERLIRFLEMVRDARTSS